jgi:hypothetical protein
MDKATKTSLLASSAVGLVGGVVAGLAASPLYLVLGVYASYKVGKIAKKMVDRQQGATYVTKEEDQLFI